MLDVKPKRALASVHDAVQAATRIVTGGRNPDSASEQGRIVCEREPRRRVGT